MSELCTVLVDDQTVTWNYTDAYVMIVRCAMMRWITVPSSPCLYRLLPIWSSLLEKDYPSTFQSGIRFLFVLRVT